MPKKMEPEINTDTPGGRCGWCAGNDLYRNYHDKEWGVPCYDDAKLFEFIILESAQAGLAWITILKKRENYRKALDGFDAEKVARYNSRSVARLMADPGIIRNRLKIEAAITNARCFLDIKNAYGSFSNYFWQFTDGEPVINYFRTLREVPAVTPLAEKICKDMKRRGFRFFGPTICYAHMQATGMVNDHLVGCFRHRELV